VKFTGDERVDRIITAHRLSIAWHAAIRQHEVAMLLPGDEAPVVRCSCGKTWTN
jgi:hypothetical protein